MRLIPNEIITRLSKCGDIKISSAILAKTYDNVKKVMISNIGLILKKVK